MTKRIKVNVFDDLRDALAEALAYEHGQSVDLRVTEFPPPPRQLSPAEIRAIRQSLNASQALFARLLNVSANAVESWEQGVRRPRSAAVKLLDIAHNYPQVLLFGTTSPHKRRRRRQSRQQQH